MAFWLVEKSQVQVKKKYLIALESAPERAWGGLILNCAPETAWGSSLEGSAVVEQVPAIKMMMMMMMVVVVVMKLLI